MGCSRAGLVSGKIKMGVVLVLALGCGHELAAPAPSGVRVPADASSPEPPPDDGTDEPGTGGTIGNDLMGCTGMETRLEAEGDHNGGTEAGIDFDVLLPFPVVLTEEDATFGASIADDQSSVGVSASREGSFSEQVSVRVALGTGDGTPLERRVYQVDERQEGSPVMNIGASAPWYPAGVENCGTSCGGFRVIELEVDQGQVTRLVASFEQFCRCDDEAAFRGCVSFVR